MVGKILTYRIAYITVTYVSIRPDYGQKYLDENSLFAVATRPSEQHDGPGEDSQRYDRCRNKDGLGQEIITLNEQPGHVAESDQEEHGTRYSSISLQEGSSSGQADCLMASTIRSVSTVSFTS